MSAFSLLLPLLLLFFRLPLSSYSVSLSLDVPRPHGTAPPEHSLALPSFYPGRQLSPAEDKPSARRRRSGVFPISAQSAPARQIGEAAFPGAASIASRRIASQRFPSHPSLFPPFDLTSPTTRAFSPSSITIGNRSATATATTPSAQPLDFNSAHRGSSGREPPG